MTSNNVTFGIGEALEEVKKGSKSQWSLFAWKLGAIFGITGGAAGGITANVPGAVIGGVGSAAVGGAIGHQIKKGVNKDIDKAKPQEPCTLPTKTHFKVTKKK